MNGFIEEINDFLEYIIQYEEGEKKEASFASEKNLSTEIIEMESGKQRI